MRESIHNSKMLQFDFSIAASSSPAKSSLEYIEILEYFMNGLNKLTFFLWYFLWQLAGDSGLIN
jgi:hypothetical protein